MKNPKLLMLLLAVVCLMTSCKKDDDEETNKTKLLIDKNWKMTAATIDPAISVNGSAPISNLYAQYENCEKDDITKFNSNGSVVFDEGASKCDVEDAQTFSGTWNFNTDQTVLSVSAFDVTTSYTIHELTSNTLRVSYSYRDYDTDVMYTMTETYTRQ